MCIPIIVSSKQCLTRSLTVPDEMKPTLRLQYHSVAVALPFRVPLATKPEVVSCWVCPNEAWSELEFTGGQQPGRSLGMGMEELPQPNLGTS